MVNACGVSSLPRRLPLNFPLPSCWHHHLDSDLVAGDWEMTVPNKCDPVKGAASRDSSGPLISDAGFGALLQGQRVTHVAPSGCRGGVPKPPDSWRPCPGVPVACTWPVETG